VSFAPVNVDREIDSQIVNWTKWVASSRRGAIHDSIGVAGQNRTAWNPSTVVNKATHSSSRRFNAKVLVSAIGARNCGIFVLSSTRKVQVRRYFAAGVDQMAISGWAVIQTQ
jgi:hypothetical protein